MKIFKIVIIIGILIASAWFVERAMDSYKCLWDQPRTDIFQSGLQLDMQRKWCHLDSSSAVDYAQDIAALYIDSRLHTGCDTQEYSCVQTNIMYKNDVLWKGWKVRLYLSTPQAQWVEMLIGFNGQIREISSAGEFLGAYWVGQFMMTANCRTTDLCGGGDKMLAALTSMDIVRVIAGPIINLYVSNVESNNLGGWGVTIAVINEPDVYYYVKLSKHYSLLGFREK